MLLSQTPGLNEDSRTCERRYRALFESSPEAIMLTLTDGRITAANPAACDLFGMTEPEIRRAGRDGIIDSSDTRHDELVQDREHNGRTHGEAFFIRKDGSRFLAEVKSVIIGKDPDGRQAFVILHDITARRQQEEALWLATQRLQMIFDNAGVGISEVGSDDSILMVNDRHCEITGRTREELIGERGRVMWHPEDADRCARLQADLKKGLIDALTDERRYLRPDGRVVWVRVNARRVPSPDGETPRRIAVIEDITANKEAQIKLKESEEALRLSNEGLEAKVQERPRDLQSLAAQLRALASDLTLTEQRERRRLAGVLHDHLQQLLVSAKLQLGSLETATPDEIGPVVAHLDKMMGDAVKMTRSLSAELSPPVLHEGGLKPALQWLARWTETRYGFTVDLSLPEEIPVTAEDVKILLFDSVRELLFNAIKHARVQRAALEVDVMDGVLRIAVEDHGLGFDPAGLKPASETGGGFGLFSIRERLNLIGGNLDIDSSPSKGARFTLNLRLSHPETNVSQNKIRVMLVDDHAIMREGLARLLGQEKDMEIAGQAGDGLAAVAMAKALCPDVILMDISMPHLNGVEATRIIHANNPEICIIGLSMYDEDHMASEIQRAGARCLLSKAGPACDLKRLIRDYSKRPAI
jgi:PAS domain S-box-containing protein